MIIEQVCQTLAHIAPLKLAESWDNVGLLVGDRKADCTCVMTCLTISPDVVREAIKERVNLIVSHHPLPFKPMAKLTTDTVASGMVYELAANQIAVYSAHTAFDSASLGINRQLAEGLSLSDIRPISPDPSDEQGLGLGSGRIGRWQGSFADLLQRTAQFLNLTTIRYIGDLQADVTKVALACGSGGSFLDAARRKGCDAMVTGESNFHACLEAESTSVGLILVGHYASERFAMENLATQIASEHTELTVWASRAERDPIKQFSL